MGVWETLPQLAAVTGEIKAVTKLAERYRELFGKGDSNGYQSFDTNMHPKVLAVMKAYAPDHVYFRVAEKTAVNKLQPALRILSDRQLDIVRSIRALTPRPVVVNLSLQSNPNSDFFLDDAVAIAVTVKNADVLPKLILKKVRADLKN